MKCAGCHLESERTEIFRITDRFLKPQAALCPVCIYKSDHRSNTLFFWGSLILGSVSLPLTIFEPTHTIGSLLLNFSALQLCAILATVIHELGHIIAGRVAGFREFRVEIGKGRVVYDFYFGGLHWRFRAPY